MDKHLDAKLLFFVALQLLHCTSMQCLNSWHCPSLFRQETCRSSRCKLYKTIVVLKKKSKNSQYLVVWLISSHHNTSCLFMHVLKTWPMRDQFDVLWITVFFFLRILLKCHISRTWFKIIIDVMFSIRLIWFMAIFHMSVFQNVLEKLFCSHMEWSVLIYLALSQFQRPCFNDLLSEHCTYSKCLYAGVISIWGGIKIHIWLEQLVKLIPILTNNEKN